MYLFSRNVTMQGNPRDVVPFATEICAAVNERTPFDVSLWRVLLGAPVGTFAYSTLIESRAALLAGMAQLENDQDYLALVDRGNEFLAAPPEDRLVNTIHSAEGELRRADVGAAATIAAAQIEVDRSADALAWSVGLTDLLGRITGVPVHLGTVEHGVFGELQWTSTVPDIAEVDRALELLGKDEDYLAFFAGAKDLFIPGSGRQILAVRIA